MPSFLTPVALALGALAIPIVLLYMLRLRRTEMPISSTFLWQQLVRDREANAPWQRLRPSWLLLLQLLILAALVLALARPYLEVSTITTGRIVLLLDASASMQATDSEPTRFAAARAIGLDMVDTLGPDDTMTVIRVSSVPEVLAAASRDKLVLRSAIRSAQVSDGRADWTAAMTLAAAGAVGVDTLKVVIVSDGGLPRDLPSVPGDVRFVPVGREAGNLAVSALATSALPGRSPELFARISNYGDADTDVIFSGYLNGSDVIDWAYRYSVPAEGYVDLFDIALPDDFDTVTTRLTLPSNARENDYLAVDDTAAAVREQAGAGRVLLVTDDNIFLRQIFRSLRGVTLVEAAPGGPLPQQPFDLFVFDGWLPDTLPDGDLLLVNPPRATEFFTLGGPVEAGLMLQANRDDPRTRNLGATLNAVNLRQYRALGGIEWATVLLSDGDAPLVVAGEVENRQVAILAFDARYPNTDLVLQPAWPILIAELSSWFSPQRVSDVSGSLTPGTPVRVRFIDDADDVVIVRPDGGRMIVKPEASEAVFADTFQPGLYRLDLRRDGQIVTSEWFAVNLFDPAESRIAPERSIVIGTTTIDRDAREETGRREYWRWVAGIGLALLAVEWWVYHRSLRRIPRIRGGDLHGRRTAVSWRAFLARLTRREPRETRSTGTRWSARGPR